MEESSSNRAEIAALRLPLQILVHLVVYCASQNPYHKSCVVRKEISSLLTTNGQLHQHLGQLNGSLALHKSWNQA